MGDDNRPTARETLETFYGEEHALHTPIRHTTMRTPAKGTEFHVDCSCGAQMYVTATGAVADRIRIGLRNVWRGDTTS
jgi:hypothetical protein